MTPNKPDSTNQEKLLAHVNNPETTKRAAEGSMDKRAKVLYPQSVGVEMSGEIDKILFELTDISYGEFSGMSQEAVNKLYITLESDCQIAKHAITSLIASEKEKAWNEAYDMGYKSGLFDQDTDKVNRLEVIDDTGRAYIKGLIYGTPVKVELSYQDNGRTLKVFVSNQ